MRSVRAFVPEALVATQVGTWVTDFERDITVADAVTAALFGVDPDLAAAGLPLAAYARAIHHDDLTDFHGKLSQVREQGGLFVVEYRTWPTPINLRWILARGRCERDAGTGGVIGQGIVIDITESKTDGHVEDRAFFLTAAAGEALDRAASHAIAAREAIDEITGPEGPALRRTVDALLWEVGRALSRRNSD